MAEEDRVRAVREARRKSTAELLEWRVRRTLPDSFRSDIVDYELKSRCSKAAIIAAVLGAVVGAVAGALLPLLFRK